jgi:hypothetical protein
MPLVQIEQERIIHWILIIFHEYHDCHNPIMILTKIAECNIILSLCFDQSCVVADRVSISIQSLPVWAPSRVLCIFWRIGQLFFGDLSFMYLKNRRHSCLKLA